MQWTHPLSGSALDSPFLGQIFASTTMRTVFEPRRTIQRYLEVEIALAKAQADNGLIPERAAAVIAAELSIERIDLERYARDVELVGFPIAPLVEQIAEDISDGLGEYVHWGATTQDIMDTALVLQMREGFSLIRTSLTRLRSILAKHARRHRGTVMLGRSQLQHAPPVTFGLKAATWLSMFQRHGRRLDQLEERLYVLQLGGAVGTLSALGHQGPAVRRALAAELDLRLTPGPWHTTRDTLVEAVTFLANLTASLGKIGQDILLLAQSDVAEVSERPTPGRGVSSTMPQKHNPVSSQLLTVAASAVADHAGSMLRASVQDHERASGRWMTEWRIVPEVFVLSGGAMERAVELLEGLVVDTKRMRVNLARAETAMSEAVMMALAPHLGRQRAHTVVARAVQVSVSEQLPLHTVLATTPDIRQHLTDDDIERSLRPDNYLGATETFIDDILAAEQPLLSGEPSR